MGGAIIFPQELGIGAYPGQIDSGQQFPLPPAGYGGALTSGSCEWPGPDPDIFVNGFGGQNRLRWRDYGSFTTS